MTIQAVKCPSCQRPCRQLREPVLRHSGALTSLREKNKYGFISGNFDTAGIWQTAKGGHKQSTQPCPDSTNGISYSISVRQKWRQHVGNLPGRSVNRKTIKRQISLSKSKGETMLKRIDLSCEVVGDVSISEK